MEGIRSVSGQNVERLYSWQRRRPDADILVVTSSWPNDERPSYGVFIKRQVESLERAGARVDVLVIHGYRSPLAYPVVAAVLAVRCFARRHYRLVHAHGGEAGVAAWFYRAAPLLVSYCGDDLLGTPDEQGRVSFARRAKRWVLRRHAARAAATITKTAEMERVLPDRVRGRNTVLPNGVDPDEFRPMPRDEARQALGWGDEPVVLFAADAAVARKRFWLAEAACRAASDRLPGVRVEQTVRVPPGRMPLLMNAADCLILTSVHEGSPNVVKEALMCNLPVVTTPVGDVETLLDGVTPSRIADPTPGALADGLVECLDPPRRSNGRDRAAWLAAPRIAERILEKYAQVAGDADVSSR